MTDPVSILDCSRYLGVTPGQVKAAISAGVVRHGLGEGKVKPVDVMATLVDMGVLRHCPCCGAGVGEAPAKKGE